MKIAVVGGGITGLTIAHELSKQGKEILLFEKDSQLGGLVKSDQKENWDWPAEIFFHHYFKKDKELKAFLAELGLSDKLFYKPVETSVYTNGEIYPFDKLGDYLKFPHLSWPAKIRMGAAIFFMRAFPYLPVYSRITAEKFFPRLIGEPAWEEIWQPLMKGKFGGFDSEVAFSWLWARIKARSVELGYLQGGSQVLIDRLEKKLSERSVRVFTNQAVSQIHRKEKKWEVRTDDKTELVDKVVLAVPVPQALSIIEDTEAVSNQKKIKYQSLKNLASLVLVLRLKKKFLPDDSYWLNILDSQFPFVALIEHTNFIDPEKYGGEHLVYAGGYYQQNEKIINQNPAEIFKEFSSFLRRLNPSFESFLIGYQVFKYPWAQPVIELDYPQKKPGYELVPGQIYWATGNHIFPWDRGLNHSIKMGREISRLV